jgi:hypothetical protein
MDEANEFMWSFSALSIIIKEMGTVWYALLKCPKSLEADAYQEHPVCMMVSFTSFAVPKYEQQPCTILFRL